MINLQHFYNSLNLNIKFTIKHAYDCNTKHQTILHNIQHKWKNCSYTTFLKQIENNIFKGQFF